ncbi:MAG: Rossmann-like and DUF2520 domain-containing protein, partial [Planctomycetota bacterium]
LEPPGGGRMRIALVGCGAAGRPLGRVWIGAGHELGAVRACSRAAEAVAAMGGGVPDGSLDGADVVVFATPDDVLAAVASHTPLRPEQVALHLSGAVPSGVLELTGARTASLHPLCAFADLETSVAMLPGTFFFVEGEAVEVAERLARDAGGRPVRLRPDRKTLYHAGAAVASNYLVTLLALARDLFTAAGVDEGVALEALGRLGAGALRNVLEVGIPRGLTGPVARGDVEVVARHLDALDPDARELYRALLRATIPLARAKGGLSAEAARALRGLV